MSVARLRTMLDEAAFDDRISLDEVQRLIDCARDETKVTTGELFLLEAALEAHRSQLSPEAVQALERFLAAEKDGSGKAQGR
jgi:hypothetical protein